MDFQTNSIAIRVSRDMAVLYGWVQPTDEERAEQERWRAEWERRNEIARGQWLALLPQLEALAGVERAVLDLHATDGSGQCGGCDWSGSEGEPPDWPCRTVEVIATNHGLAIPEYFDAGWLSDTPDRHAP